MKDLEFQNSDLRGSAALEARLKTELGFIPLAHCILEGSGQTDSGLFPLFRATADWWQQRPTFLLFLKYALKFKVLLAVALLLFGCHGENAPDCLQNSGDLIRGEVSLSEFTKITVFENVALVLKQGDVQRVEIETGEYLRDEISATVEGDRLLLKDTNDCNYFREYGLTTVYVTSPDISEIRSSTGWPIKSDGVLGYESLTLLSESFNNPESETTDGEFDLEVDTQNLGVVVNGIAYFKLKGNTENLRLTIAAGDSRIEAGNLSAQSVSLNHRGSNDMFVNPQRVIFGRIRGVGDVISSNRPDTVTVEELYKGRLVFK